MVVTKRETGLFINGQMRRKRCDAVEDFEEKPVGDGAWINGGFFVLNKEIFDHLTEEENCDFEFGALEELAGKGELMVYEHKGSWECMDTLRETEHLNELWKSGKAFWKKWK